MEIASSTLLASIGTDLGGVVSLTTTALFPLVLVVGGVPFAFYVLRKIIALIPKR